MSSFEWNKIIASVLTAMIVAMVSGILAGQLVRPKELEQAVYCRRAPKRARRAAPARRRRRRAASRSGRCSPRPIRRRASRSPKSACMPHLQQGRRQQDRPELVRHHGREHGRRAGLPVLAALEAHKGEKWDPEKLNHWLCKPQDFVKGTKMTFPGLPKAQDRADVIAYLESLK